MPRVARTQELPELPDGIYSIQVNGADRVRFQIHTVMTGQLAGQRIVKKQQGTMWKGFAFVKVDAYPERNPLDPESDGEDAVTYNGIQVWRSMQTAVTESYARNVSLSIRRFIGRVNNEPEDVSTFIMIEDCPELPERVRAQLEAQRRVREEIARREANRRNLDAAREAINARRARTVSGAGYTTTNTSATEYVTSWNNNDEDDRVPRRTSPLAMSCFHPEEVR